MPDIQALLLDSRDLGGDSTGFNTNNFTPGANKTILFISSGIGSVPPPEPVIPIVSNGNGIAYSLVASQKFDWSGTNRGIVNVFRGVATTPTLGFSRVQYNRTFFRQAMMVWEFSGTDIGNLGANAIAQSDTKKILLNGGLNPFITMPAGSDPANSSLGIIAYRDDGGNPGINPGIGFVILLNLPNAEGGGIALEMSQTVRTNVDFQVSNDPDFAMIGIELKNNVPAPPPAGPQVFGRPAFISGNLIT